MKLAESQTIPVKSENAQAEHERLPGKRPAIAEEKITVEEVEPVGTSETETKANEPVGMSSRSSEARRETKPDGQEFIPTETAPDLNQIWIDIVTEVRKSRPLIQEYFAAAVPVSLLHNELRLGFGSQHGMAMETLLRPNNRKYIEQLLTDKLGTPTSIRGETRDDLTPIVFPNRTETAASAESDFKNDPLIQKALEIFQAEIQAAD
jgi:hypothetical protein